MRKFKVGNIVMSKLNDFTLYKVTKVNKESLDIIETEHGFKFQGIPKELMYHKEKT